MRGLRVAAVVLAAGVLPLRDAAAVTARSWDASSARVFAAGTLDGTSIDADGRVRLAPELTTVWGPEAGIVWAVAPGPAGTALVALSGPGRLLRVGAGIDPETWYRAEGEALVTALVADGSGGAYFGVSPSGAVHHARSSEDVRVVAETEAAFVWSLAAHGSTLWIGTGVPGRLLALESGGQARTRFDAGEDPVRCIALARDGSVLIGTGGRGRVVRVAADDRASVIFDAAETEVVALAEAEDGTVYVLTAESSKQVARARTPAPAESAGVTTVRVVATPPENGTREESEEPGERSAEAQPEPPAQAFRTTAGGVLYRVAPDGTARKIWTVDDAMPFAMVRAAGHELLVGTGDDGRVHAIDGQGHASSLAQIESDQASALATTPAGAVLIGGTTDARLAVLDAGRPREKGSFVTPPIDAGAAAEWGRVRWDAELPEGTRIEVSVRTGNSAEPDETWTPWVPSSDSTGDRGAIASRARWLQARFELLGKRGRSPVVRRIEVLYLPQNRPPEVQALDVEAPGVILAPGPVSMPNRPGAHVAMDPIARAAVADLDANARAARAPRRGYEVGARTFTWRTSDPDGDALRQRLEVRAEGTEEWIPLAAEIEGDFFSWDARAMPDGTYRVRLTVDDAPDNAEGRHLLGSRVSAAFDVDNRRPTLEVVRSRALGDGRFEAELAARDPGGRIAVVEVPDGRGGWRPLEADDGVADSPDERYWLRLEAGSASPAPMPVRVVDAAGNVGGALVRF